MTRTVVHVTLAGPLAAELRHRAQAVGVDPADETAFATWLGDLAAAGAPDALADAARHYLAERRVIDTVARWAPLALPGGSANLPEPPGSEP